MFSGGITYDKMSPLIEVKSNLNSQNYISQILEPCQQFWRKSWRKNKRALFMQDNAPSHTSNNTESGLG